MKNIIIASSYTSAEVEVFKLLSKSGENFERAICTDDRSEVSEAYPTLKVEKYLDEYSKVVTVIETTNYIVFPRNISYGYSGEGSRGLVSVLKEFDVFTNSLEEKIYDFNTKSLLINPTSFEWVGK